MFTSKDINNKLEDKEEEEEEERKLKSRILKVEKVMVIIYARQILRYSCRLKRSTYARRMDLLKTESCTPKYMGQRNEHTL